MLTRWNWILTYGGPVPRIIPILLHFPRFRCSLHTTWLTIRPRKWGPQCPVSNYSSLMLCSPLNFAALPSSHRIQWKHYSVETTSPTGKGEYLAVCVWVQTVPTEQQRSYMQTRSFSLVRKLLGVGASSYSSPSKRKGGRWLTELEGMFSYHRFLQEWTNGGSRGFLLLCWIFSPG